MDIYNTDRKYKIIYADPPWKYSDRRCNGNADGHYNTMKLEDICKLPIKQISEKDCVLFLWVTYPMMEEGLKLIKDWGFTYKSIAFQWIKLNKKGIGYFFGLGRWTRGNTEPCLIAVKGKPQRVSASVSQLIFSSLQKHSQKPDEAREKIIKLMGDLPRIELFARQQYQGWDCWGNEVKEIKDQIYETEAAAYTE